MKLEWLRPTLIAALILCYALLAHYSNAHHLRQLGATLASGPPLLALLLLARRAWRSWFAVVAAMLVAALLLRHYWNAIERSYSLLYLLQDCGIYLLLAAEFGRSLLAGRQPLCTQWAEGMRGILNEQARAYTRGVTLAWTVFFVIIVLMSVTLYALKPLSTWSVFANFVTLPLVLLMFVCEYLLRHRLNPSLSRISLLETVRAYVVFARSGSAPRA